MAGFDRGMSALRESREASGIFEGAAGRSLQDDRDVFPTTQLGFSSAGPSMQTGAVVARTLPGRRRPAHSCQRSCARRGVGARAGVPFVFLSIVSALLGFAPRCSGGGYIDGVDALAPITAGDFGEHVLVLTADNFADAVAAHEHILVQFYAPWCGHCKQFRSEYIRAARKLKEKGVPLAVVDATSETKLAELYQVRGYPTLKFFVSGIEMEYGGGRMAENLIAWVEKKSGPSLVQLSSAAEVEQFFVEKAREETPSGTSPHVGGGVVVAFSDDPASIHIMESVAIAFDDIFFALAPPSLIPEVCSQAALDRAAVDLQTDATRQELPLSMVPGIQSFEVDSVSILCSV